MDFNRLININTTCDIRIERDPYTGRCRIIVNGIYMGGYKSKINTDRCLTKLQCFIRKGVDENGDCIFGIPMEDELHD